MFAAGGADSLDLLRGIAEVPGCGALQRLVVGEDGGALLLDSPRGGGRRYDVKWLCGLCEIAGAETPPQLKLLQKAAKVPDITGLLSARHPALRQLRAVADQELERPAPPPPEEPPVNSNGEIRCAARRNLAAQHAAAIAAADSAYSEREVRSVEWLPQVREERRRQDEAAADEVEAGVRRAEVARKQAREEIFELVIAARRNTEVREGMAFKRIVLRAETSAAYPNHVCGAVRRGSSPGAGEQAPPAAAFLLAQEESRRRRHVLREERAQRLWGMVEEQKEEQRLGVLRIRRLLPLMRVVEGEEGVQRDELLLEE
eukprot:Hpha_TRINITY_DN20291_c0_g1::TRINITY_DN20291_c0_g1_i1::g.168298::m.168298